MPTVRLHRFAGIANRLPSDDARKQPPDPRDRDGRMFVDVLENGYVTDDGRIDAAPGPQVAATGTQWGRCISADAGLIAHDKGAGTLVLNPGSESPTTLVSGLSLSRAVSFAKMGGRVYWTNGAAEGAITAGGAAVVWSLPACPVPALGSTTGTLPAGAYLVMGTWLSSDGREHSSAGPGYVALSAAGAITASFGTPPTGATHVRLYVSTGPNTDIRGILGDVAVGSLPYTITTLPTNSSNERPEALGPVPTHSRLWSYRDKVLVAVGNEVYPSFIGGHTFWYGVGGDAYQAPATVIGGAGLASGYYLLTADSLYWISGDDAATQTRVLRAEFAAGSEVVSAQFFPSVNVSGDVALFWCNRGLVIGLDGGNVLVPQWNVLDVPAAGYEASFADWTGKLAITVA